MKINQIAAAAMSLALIGGAVPFTEALAPQIILTAEAAGETSVLPSLPIVSKANATVFTGSKNASFRMGGRIYNQGAVLTPSNTHNSEITFETSYINSFSFTLGHIENTGFVNNELKVYLDDVLTDTIRLDWTMAIKKYTFDVSQANQISFIIEAENVCSYGLGDITTDKESPAISSSGTNYKEMNSVLVAAFDGLNTERYYGTDRSKFFRMCGREYYEGIVFSAPYKGGSSSVSFNVENCSKLSCSLGHTDNEEINSGRFNFYIDNKLAKSVEVTANGPVQECTIEIPDGSKCLRIEFFGDGECSFGAGDIVLDKYGIENKYSAPVYKSTSEIIKNAYNVIQGQKCLSDAVVSSFNVNGRTYYNGILFSTSSGDTTGSVTFNTENCNKLSFSVGKADDAAAKSGVLNIYYDGVKRESIKLDPFMNAKELEFDVKNVKNVRAEIDVSASEYALMDIKADALTVEHSHEYPRYSSSEELLENAYNFPSADVHMYTNSLKNDSFNMSGRTYYDGFTVDQKGPNSLRSYNICMNVEDIDKISWDTGYVDDSDFSHDSQLNIYIDNELRDKITLNKNMGIHKCSYNVSEAATLRLEFNINSCSSYGIGSLRADKLTHPIAPDVPEYRTTGDFFDAGFNRSKAEVFNGSEPETRIITIGEKQYDKGVVLTSDGSGDCPEISFNTENIDGIKFRLGMISDKYKPSGTATVSVYKDNELYQKISLDSNSALVTAGVDTTDTDVVRFEMVSSDGASLGLVDMEIGKFDASSLTTAPPSTTAVTTTTVPVSVSNMFGDINGDGIIDGRDATILLTYYAKTSTGYTGTLEKFVAEIGGKVIPAEKPNKYGFYTVKDAAPTGVSVKALEGEWSNVNRDNQLLTFSRCDILSGSFTLNESGSIRKGTVKTEYSLTPDNNKEYWYNLYNEDGSFFMGFGITGELPLDDLYAGQSGDPHFRRCSAETTTTKAAATTTKGTSTTTKATTTKAAATTTKATSTTAAAGKEQPDPSGFYEVKNAPPSGVSIDALTGTWVNADNNDQYLFIRGEGLYSGNYRMGDLIDTESEGIIRLEYSLTPDGTKEYWYNLYDKDGKFVMGFGVTGDLPLYDLFAGQSGSPHFKRSAV